MTVKVIQSNERVAEVQFLCDCCGVLVRTSLISLSEVEALKNTDVMCWNCKQSKASRN